MLEKGVPFEHRIIDLSAKPDDFVSKYRKAAGEGAWGSAKVPLLEHGENLVVESDLVAKYIAEHVHLDGRFNEDLYPSSSSYDACQQIDAFLEIWLDVVDHYYDILTVPPSSGETGVMNTMNVFERSLGALENVLSQNSASKDGAFVLGRKFSLAECIAAPWVQRFYVTLPHFRSVNFQETLLPFGRTAKWMSAVRRRKSVVESKCPEEEIIAAANRYYVSYITPGSPGAS